MINKTTLIIIGCAVILLSLILILMVMRRIQPTTSNLNISPTLTQEEPTVSAIQPSINEVVSPTPLLSEPFTGGIMPTFPPQEVATSDQQAALQLKLPVQTSQFTINFDYANDIFIVTLVQPADKSKTAFDTWLKTNYPAIPIVRFKFQ
jgi:hypothetical protein